jgi:hypothetical protein
MGKRVFCKGKPPSRIVTGFAVVFEAWIWYKKYKVIMPPLVVSGRLAGEWITSAAGDYYYL